MRFEWDERKSRQNRRKHAVSFELAAEVFADPFSVTIYDRTVEGDERYWTIGSIAARTILVVVHTMRDEQGEEVIRILSARKATPRERKFHEEADS